MSVRFLVVQCSIIILTLTDKINDYRSKGLSVVKMTENRNIAVHKLRLYK